MDSAYDATTELTPGNDPTTLKSNNTFSLKNTSYLFETSSDISTWKTDLR